MHRLTNNRKLRRLVSLFIIGVAVTILWSLLTRAIRADVDELYAKTLRRDGGELVSFKLEQSSSDQTDCGVSGYPNARLLGIETAKPGTYRIWIFEERGSALPTMAVTVESPDGLCGIGFDERLDDAITNRLPLPIARSLMVQLISNIADQDYGGIEGYIEFFTGGNPNHETHSEDITEKQEIDSVLYWALNELGVPVSADDFTVIDIDNAWIYDYQPEL